LIYKVSVENLFPVGRYRL